MAKASHAMRTEILRILKLRYPQLENVELSHQFETADMIWRAMLKDKIISPYDPPPPHIKITGEARLLWSKVDEKS